MTQIKYILSDLDGVIRKFPSKRDAVIEKKYNLALGTLFNIAFDKINLEKAVCGHITDEEWRSRIEKSLSLLYNEATAKQAIKEWSDFAGVVDHDYLNYLEQQFPRCPIVLLTNGTTRLLSDLKNLRIENYFFKIINSADIGFCKPDKRIFEYVLDILSCSPSEVLFIDDSLTHVKIAEEIGIKSHHYKSLNKFKEFSGNNKPIVRKATIQDAEGIHLAHMKSIQQICSKDHSEEEIKAWGHRPYREDQRINAIKNDLVWVVDDNGSIEGYGHLKIFEKEGVRLGHIFGLYLTPQVAGNSLGRAIVDKMMEEINFSKAMQITLESTITAKEFYKKIGFVPNGSELTVEINGTQIRCYPMMKRLHHT